MITSIQIVESLPIPNTKRWNVRLSAQYEDAALGQKLFAKFTVAVENAADMKVSEMSEAALKQLHLAILSMAETSPDEYLELSRKEISYPGQ